MSEPVLTGWMLVVGLPSGPGFVTEEGNMPGCSFEKDSKNGTARSEGFGCGVAGFFWKPQKAAAGSTRPWCIEPITLPSASCTMLPFACDGNRVCPISHSAPDRFHRR